MNFWSKIDLADWYNSTELYEYSSREESQFFSHNFTQREGKIQTNINKNNNNNTLENWNQTLDQKGILISDLVIHSYVHCSHATLYGLDMKLI